MRTISEFWWIYFILGLIAMFFAMLIAWTEESIHGLIWAGVFYVFAIVCFCHAWPRKVSG